MLEIISNLITIIAILCCIFNMEKFHRRNDFIGVIKEGFLLLCICMVVAYSKM